MRKVATCLRFRGRAKRGTSDVTTKMMQLSPCLQPSFSQEPQTKMHEVIQRLNSVQEFQFTPAANAALQRAKEEAQSALVDLVALEKAFLSAMVDQVQIIAYEFAMSDE